MHKTGVRDRCFLYTSQFVFMHTSNQRGSIQFDPVAMQNLLTDLFLISPQEQLCADLEEIFMLAIGSQEYEDLGREDRQDLIFCSRRIKDFLIDANKLNRPRSMPPTDPSAGEGPASFSITIKA